MSATVRVSVSVVCGLVAATTLLAGCFPSFEVGAQDGAAEGGPMSDGGHSEGGTRDGSPDARSDASGCATDAGAIDTGIVPLQSCTPGGPGRTTCGVGGSGTESCCASLPVKGGTFYRDYDALTFTDTSFPATVSDFRLDRYEVTVGRFREFVNAVIDGWKPPPGSGKHSYVNCGKGLASLTGGFEPGWDAVDWNTLLAPTATVWNTRLACDASVSTWSPTVGGNESKPIVCEDWFEAYAFCIWDGGFLPSDAEWNYAAAGGGGPGGQRVYPWSSPSTSTAIDCSTANYGGADGGVDAACASGTQNVGTDSPLGDGVFGHADLGGNAYEYALDWEANLLGPCVNCVYLVSSFGRVIRGGAFNSDTSALLNSVRGRLAPKNRSLVTARCARAP